MSKKPLPQSKQAPWERLQPRFLIYRYTGPIVGNPVQRHYGKADSGAWIEGFGIVRRLLPDDREDSRHQRCVLDLRNGQTILVTHNIDLAERVPLGMGDRVRFRGMYEYNDEGGLLHWTHRDPLGVEQGGFIRYRGKNYQ